MSAADLHAELEAELAWRQSEIRFLQNQCMKLSKDEIEIYLRALILMVYAHVEGFTKFALAAYIRNVNNSGIKCSDAHYAIVAASLSDLFHALRNPDKKSKDFSNVEDDAALHRFARDREFVERATEYMAQPVQIPDAVVNTESNLWPVVLKKNLYRLGLPHSPFDKLAPDLNRLVQTRNNIGHGADRRGIEWKQYEKLRDGAFSIMQELRSNLFSALSLQWYKRHA